MNMDRERAVAAWHAPARHKLRIGVVAACPFPVPRGTPIRILRMAEALAERGHEVHVVTYHLGSGPVAPGVQLHRIDDIPSYRKLSPGPSYRKLIQVDTRLARLLRRLARELAFDVLHAHHYEGALVAGYARRGLPIPVVFDAHTLLMSELPFYPLGLPVGVKRSLGIWMDRWIPRLADHTVTVTEAIHDRLIQDAGIAPDEVTVIANGVELEHFDPATHPPAPGARAPTLVFTGNLAEYQGIDLMLEAFARVLRRKPAARLLIGSDSPFAPYEALAARLGVRGSIDIVDSPAFTELPALLARGDVALNPRVDCQGVPVKLLNYMAAARPVVSFAGSAPGVTHAKTGWLAPSGDIAAFADGIVALLEQPDSAAAIGRAGRAYVAANCSWPAVAERCEALYERLIAARSS
jgi:glycosyltransferase involved in cell wall biosynthesis